MIKKESCISVKEKAGWRWSVLERQSSREREGGTIEREMEGEKDGEREITGCCPSLSRNSTMLLAAPAKLC